MRLFVRLIFNIPAENHSVNIKSGALVFFFEGGDAGGWCTRILQ